MTICKIGIKWEFALWHGELNPVLCDNIKGGDRVEDERGLQEREDVCITMADSY